MNVMPERILPRPPRDPLGRARQPADQDPAELDDSAAQSPDREPGRDNPRQRPITDNKAGG